MLFCPNTGDIMRKVFFIGTLTACIPFLLCVFTGCTLPFNTTIQDDRGSFTFKEDFLNANRTYGTVFCRDENGNVIADPTVPEFRTFIITEKTKLDEIFSVFPDIDLKKEGVKILEKTNKNAYKIALCIEGKKLSSEDFACLLYSERAINAQSVDFIIGSSHGLSDEVKKSCDYLLSFSDMTFSHRLARVMLMEQIYRAYAIETGRKYHK